jgi:2-keto-4-pentenoate hydratase/2-oxohepta-3-ene-1,7-dioic acid hydratase in catechol pathway
MPAFRLAAITKHGQPRPVVLAEDHLIDVQDALQVHQISAPAVDGRLDILPMLDDWDQWLPVLRQVAALRDPSVTIRAADATFLAPIRYPRKLLLAGANYTDHVKEMGAPPPSKDTHRPFFFLKPPTVAVIGPNEPVVIPTSVEKADWEAELVAVVGKPARKVKQSEALNYIAGYTVLNDISARDRQLRGDWGGIFANDWLLGKCWQGFAPMGPSIIPREFVPDPYNLRITCTVNGKTMQDSNTKNLIFNIQDMVVYLSEIFLLEPGDCISTGTPAGVGMPRGVFLRDGDVVVTEVEGICRLETRIQKER